MATLQEIAEWTDGIYQLETNDPVMGGADGIDNLQAKQLASRTAWLKAAILAAADDLAAHLLAADPHTQYLSQGKGDARYAALAGLATQLFSVAHATGQHHAVALGQMMANFLAGGNYLKIPVWNATALQMESLILQWGIAVSPPNTPSGVVFPIAFPTACHCIFATNAQNNVNWPEAFNPTPSGFSIMSATPTASTAFWLAIGK